jgi:hypothetical protein
MPHPYRRRDQAAPCSVWTRGTCPERTANKEICACAACPSCVATLRREGYKAVRGLSEPPSPGSSFQALAQAFHFFGRIPRNGRVSPKRGAQ